MFELSVTEGETPEEAEARIVLDMMTLIDTLERAYPRRRLHLEAQLVWALAHRAGHYGFGSDLRRLVEDGVAEGEASRGEAAGSRSDDLPAPTTSGFGHA